MGKTIVSSIIAVLTLTGAASAGPPTLQKRPSPTPAVRPTALAVQVPASLRPPGPCGVESDAMRSFTPTSSTASPPPSARLQGSGKQAVSKKNQTRLGVPNLIGSVGQSVSVRATLTEQPGAKLVSDHTVHFWLDTTYLGSARTNSQGLAQISYTVESMTSRQITARYYGSDVCFASLGTGDLDMRKASAKLTLTTAPSAVLVGHEFLLEGKLARIADNRPIDGREVVVALDGSPLPPLATSTSGSFVWRWTPPSQTEGSHGVVVKFSGDALYTAASASHVFSVLPPPKQVWLKLQPVSGMVGEEKVVVATLFSTRDSTWRPGIEVPGVTVRVWRDRGRRFPPPQVDAKTLGSAVTDFTGTARITFTINDEPMTYDIHGQADLDTARWFLDTSEWILANLDVQKSPVTIAVTGPATARIGDSVMVAVVLKRTSDGAPLGGQSVFLQGAGSRTTMSNGAAGFNLTIGAAGGTGPRTITATFAGTSRYLAGSGGMVVNVLPKVN